MPLGGAWFGSRTVPMAIPSITVARWSSRHGEAHARALNRNGYRHGQCKRHTPKSASHLDGV